MSEATEADVTALRAAALGMQTAGLDPFNAISWRLSALADELTALRAAAAERDAAQSACRTVADSLDQGGARDGGYAYGAPWHVATLRAAVPRKRNE